MSDRKLCGLPPDVSQVSKISLEWLLLHVLPTDPVPDPLRPLTELYFKQYLPLFIYLFLLLVSPFHWNVSFTRQRLGLSISIVTVPLTLRISVIK